MYFLRNEKYRVVHISCLWSCITAFSDCDVLRIMNFYYLNLFIKLMLTLARESILYGRF